MEAETIYKKLSGWANDIRKGASSFLSSDQPNELQKAMAQNKWFVKENIVCALNSLADMISDKEHIEKWLNKYDFSIQTPRKILLILAGNIPAVGFHDVLCTLISGHKAEIKLSSDDSHIIPWLLKIAEKHFPEWKDKINYHDGLINDFDAVIATGSNQTATGFKKYFANKSHIIRHNRSSIAVIQNSDSDKDLINLSNDIFMYFGLGCRNVSLIFLPRDFNKQRIYDAFKTWEHLANHNAYANNYVYYKSYFSLTKEQPLDGSFYILRENSSTSAPVAVVHFQEYVCLA